jgi:hypothetical protein
VIVAAHATLKEISLREAGGISDTALPGSWSILALPRMHSAGGSGLKAIQRTPC